MSKSLRSVMLGGGLSGSAIGFGLVRKLNLHNLSELTNLDTNDAMNAVAD